MDWSQYATEDEPRRSAYQDFKKGLKARTVEKGRGYFDLARTLAPTLSNIPAQRDLLKGAGQQAVALWEASRGRPAMLLESLRREHVADRPLAENLGRGVVDVAELALTGGLGRKLLGLGRAGTMAKRAAVAAKVAPAAVTEAQLIRETAAAARPPLTAAERAAFRELAPTVTPPVSKPHVSARELGKVGLPADMTLRREAMAATKSGKRTPAESLMAAEAEGQLPGRLRRDVGHLDARYRQLVADPRGAISPRALLALGGTATGAAVGAAADPDDPLIGGLLGGVAGYGLARGAVKAGPAIGRHVVPALNQLRIASFLSGLALPKSVLGNIGAVGTAALEGRVPTLQVLKEAGRLPTNISALRRGLRLDPSAGGAAGVGVTNVGRYNPIARAMHGMDIATEDLLTRSGLPLEEAQRLLLRSPQATGGNLQKFLSTPAGRFIFPFQRTPWNQLSEGGMRLNELLPGQGPGWRSRALTYGSIGAGAIAGSETDDRRILGVLAALAGVRGLPFLLGASIGGARGALGSASPIPEWGLEAVTDPKKALGLEPAFFRAYFPGEP